MESEAYMKQLACALKLDSAEKDLLLEYSKLCLSPSDHSRPYDNLYAARKQLEELQILSQADKQLKCASATKGIIAARMGINLKETEETGKALNFFIQALQILDPVYWEAYMCNAIANNSLCNSETQQTSETSKSNCVSDSIWLQLERIYLYNEFATLVFGWTYFDLARETLSRAHTLLSELQRDTKDEFHSYVDELKANTVFLLAQVEMVLNNVDSATKFCEQALKLKYEMKSKYQNRNEWASDAVSLAKLLIQQNRISCAWHALCAAERALMNHTPKEEKQKVPAKDVADIDVLFGKVCVEILVNGAGECEVSYSLNLDGHADQDKILVFKKGTFQEARDIFLYGNKRFESAKKHYLLDGFVSQHIEILKGQAELYKNLSRYENDLKRKASMFNRAKNLLSPLLDQLSPKVYGIELKEISYELGAITRTIAEINKKRYDNERSSRCAKRFNSSCIEAIKYYQFFIATFDCQSKELASDADMAQAYILAHLTVGSLYFGLIENGHQKVTSYQNALEYYEKASKLKSEVLPTGSKILNTQFTLAEEVMTLIPEAISKINSAT